jgi:hypothetical protein
VKVCEYVEKKEPYTVKVAYCSPKLEEYTVKVPYCKPVVETKKVSYQVCHLDYVPEKREETYVTCEMVPYEVKYKVAVCVPCGH